MLALAVLHVAQALLQARGKSAGVCQPACGSRGTTERCVCHRGVAVSQLLILMCTSSARLLLQAAVPAEVSHPDTAQAAFELLSTVCRAVHSVAPALRPGGSLGGGDQSGLLVRKDIADLMRLLDKAATLVLRTSRELLASLPEADGEQRTAAKRLVRLLRSSAAAALASGAGSQPLGVGAARAPLQGSASMSLRHAGALQRAATRPASWFQTNCPGSSRAPACCRWQLPLTAHPPTALPGAWSAASCSTCPRWRHWCTWSRPCVTARAPSGGESCLGSQAGGSWGKMLGLVTACAKICPPLNDCLPPAACWRCEL